MEPAAVTEPIANGMVTGVFLDLLIVVFLIVMQGFFSGSEIALVSSDKIKLRHMAKQGNKGADMVLKRFRVPEVVLGTTLVGTNLATVGVSTLGSLLAINLFGQGGEIFAVLVLAPLMLIMGEIVPKSVYQQKATTISTVIIYPLTVVIYLFYPVVFFFSRMARLFTRVVSGTSTKRSPYITRDEIRSLLEMPDTVAQSSGDDRRFDKERVRSIIRYAETSVGSSMVPLADVVGIEDNESIDEAVRIVLEKGFNRIPVYRENITNIVGILTLKPWDLMDPSLRNQKVVDLMQEPIFVTPQQTVHELIPMLQVRRDRLAVVVDEFGSADGLLFLEDLFAEVIGERPAGSTTTASSHGVQHVIEQVGEDEYLVPGRTPVTQLNEELNLTLPTDEGHTIAGLLVTRWRSIPKPGASLALENYLFVIKETDGRSVTKVSIQRM